MRKTVIAFAAAALCTACGKPGAAGVVLSKSGPAPTTGAAATVPTGFFSTADLVENADGTSTTTGNGNGSSNGNGSTQSGSTRNNPPKNTGNTCLSLAKLFTFLKVNLKEPVLLTTYDLALGEMSTSGFQTSQNPQLESNYFFAGANKVSLQFTAGHLGDSDLLTPTPGSAALNPNDPSTLFNFPSQSACDTVTLADGKTTASITNPQSKSVRITVAPYTFEYVLGANAVEVNTYQPVTPSVCGSGTYQMKITYMFNFQLDMQNIRIGKNLFSLLSASFPDITDELKGVQTGLIPSASYLVAKEDIANAQAVPLTCSGTNSK